MSKAIDFLGGNYTNYNRSGNDGHLITSRAFNIVDDGRGHPVTYNQEI
jgi:hypothetical protein